MLKRFATIGILVTALTACDNEAWYEGEFVGNFEDGVTLTFNNTSGRKTLAVGGPSSGCSIGATYTVTGNTLRVSPNVVTPGFSLCHTDYIATRVNDHTMNVGGFSSPIVMKRR